MLMRNPVGMCIAMLMRNSVGMCIAMLIRNPVGTFITSFIRKSHREVHERINLQVFSRISTQQSAMV